MATKKDASEFEFGATTIWYNVPHSNFMRRNSHLKQVEVIRKVGSNFILIKESKGNPKRIAIEDAYGCWVPSKLEAVSRIRRQLEEAVSIAEEKLQQARIDLQTFEASGVYEILSEVSV